MKKNGNFYDLSFLYFIADLFKFYSIKILLFIFLTKRSRKSASLRSLHSKAKANVQSLPILEKELAYLCWLCSRILSLTS